MSLCKGKPFLTPNDKGILGTDDAASIQNAIDAAAKAGVNKVVIPRYNKRTDSMLWVIGATLRIPAQMHLVLDNCHLKLAENFAGHMFTNSLAYLQEGKLIAGEEINICLQGVGEVVLEGNGGSAADAWQSSLLYFHNVREFNVEGLRLVNTTGWGLCFMYCSYGKIAYIDFDSNGGDGVMLRCGCHELAVEDITGYTGGAVVAIQAVVGPQMEGAYSVMGPNIDVRDIIIKNIKATTRNGGNIISLFNQDGATLYNVLIESVSDISVPGAEVRPFAAVRIGGNEPVNVRKVNHGETKNVTIRNLFTHAKYAVAISTTLANSLLESIHLHDDGECVVGVFSEEDPTTLSNILIKGVHYNVEQGGEVFSFANCEGKNLVLREVMCATITHLATVSGALNAKIMDVTVDELTDTLVCAEENAEVTLKNVKVKGEMQK